MVTPATVPPRRIILRANRETLALVAAACAVTFTLSYTIHARLPEAHDVVVADAPDVPVPGQDWTGRLAGVSTDPPQPASAAPMTSASLVVPKSALALPSVPVRKIHACDEAACAVKVAPKLKPGRSEAGEREAHRDRSLLSRLNPLEHLPSMSTLGKPFAVAGETISGWMKRF